ncbi:MAG: hypothetical protein IKA20_03120 [Clostridia bacterium]|nr:hypothetical protein [Clostridia bacterium]
MEIEKVDKNFARQKPITKEGKTLYSIPSPCFSLYGIEYDEKAQGFVRLSPEYARSVSEGVEVLSRHTSGGRMCFSTDSKVLEITATYSNFWEMAHMPLSGACGFSLFETTEQGEKFVANLGALHSDKQGFTAMAQLTGDMRNYVLYFPLYNRIDSLTVGLTEGAMVKKLNPYRDIAPILYYGSSITQGGCASRPDNTYQGVICKRNRIDFISLGFSGGAKAEPAMVKYLAGIKCSLFVCDYDHNAPTAAYLKDTHYPLYKQFRAAQPNTPILFISRPDITRDKEGEERLKIIRSTYLKAKKEGDNNVYFLSGKSFYGKRHPENFAVDGFHPTDYGFALMADKIYKKMCTIDKKFRGENYD